MSRIGPIHNSRLSYLKKALMSGARYHTQCRTHMHTHHRNSASKMDSMAVFPNHHLQRSSDCQTKLNSRIGPPPSPRLLFHSSCQTSLTATKRSQISTAFLLRLYWVVLPAVTSSLTTCHRSGSTCLTVDRRKVTLMDSPKKNCMLYMHGAGIHPMHPILFYRCICCPKFYSHVCTKVWCSKCNNTP